MGKAYFVSYKIAVGSKPGYYDEVTRNACVEFESVCDLSLIEKFEEGIEDLVRESIKVGHDFSSFITEHGVVPIKVTVLYWRRFEEE